MRVADDNLVLEHLRAIRRAQDSLMETLSEHGLRLNRIEAGIASLRREQALDAENVAHHSVRIDRLLERVERLERRLDLRDS